MDKLQCPSSAVGKGPFQNPYGHYIMTYTVRPDYLRMGLPQFIFGHLLFAALYTSLTVSNAIDESDWVLGALIWLLFALIHAPGIWFWWWCDMKCMRKVLVKGFVSSEDREKLIEKHGPECTFLRIIHVPRKLSSKQRKAKGTFRNLSGRIGRLTGHLARSHGFGVIDQPRILPTDTQATAGFLILKDGAQVARVTVELHPDFGVKIYLQWGLSPLQQFAGTDQGVTEFQSELIRALSEHTNVGQES